MMGPITPGDWFVPVKPTGGARAGAGVIIVSNARGGDLIIADCTNRFVPLAEQRANARLMAEAPRMRAALRMIERQVGDLPAGKSADELYRIVTDAMKLSGIAVDLGEEAE